MTDEDIVLEVGLPKGSLNSEEPNRYCTRDTLLNAGLNVFRYDPGNEGPNPVIEPVEESDRWMKLRGWRDRPQNMPRFLERGVYDVGVFGDDLEEEFGSGTNLRLVELGGGKTTLVAAVREDLPDTLDEYLQMMHEREELTIVYAQSEFMTTSLHVLMSNETYRKLYGDSRPVRASRYTGPGKKPEIIGENSKVEIIQSWGILNSVFLTVG